MWLKLQHCAWLNVRRSSSMTFFQLCADGWHMAYKFTFWGLPEGVDEAVKSCAAGPTHEIHSAIYLHANAVVILPPHGWHSHARGKFASVGEYSHYGLTYMRHSIAQLRVWIRQSCAIVERA